MTQTIMSIATVLCLIPENVYGRLTGNELAAGCQLFYRKMYGYFLQCTSNNFHYPIHFVTRAHGLCDSCSVCFDLILTVSPRATVEFTPQHYDQMRHTASDFWRH